MDASKKVRMLMAAHNLTGSQLGEMANINQSNLSKKLKNNSFSIDDLERIAEAVNAKLEMHFVLEDGTRI